VGVELTEVSKKNLEEALTIELSNTAFYKCIAKTSDNTEIAKTFKGLSKVEEEHAEVFTKLLGIDLVETTEACEVSDPVEWIKASAEREDRAVKFYAKAAAEATEPRVKEVFQAIMQVEQTHQDLDKILLEKFSV
jgi:rubrerythrin